MSASPVPPPPLGPAALLDWAVEHGVADRLDDIIIGQQGRPGTYLPGRYGEVRTYREILAGAPVAGALTRWYDDAEETARRFLHRMATLAVAQRRRRAWLDEHGRDPEDPELVRLLERLLAERVRLAGEEGRGPPTDPAQAEAQPAARRLSARQLSERPPGTYEPAGIALSRTPVPLLRYREWALVRPREEAALSEDVALALLGLHDGPLRWRRYRGDRPVVDPGTGEDEVPVPLLCTAVDGLVDFLRDPEEVERQAELAELLRLPAWRYALDTLEGTLAGLPGAEEEAGGASDERVAFRVLSLGDGALNVEPVVQKRGRGGAFSKGARLQWFQLPERPGLGPADRKAFQAYDDRFARRSQAWGGLLSPGQIFGILRALIDHPAVFLDGPGEGSRRLDIRQGRLRLRFVGGADGQLAPRFELAGVSFLPGEVAAAVRDGRHLIHLHRPTGAPAQVLLAQLSPQAAAVVQALALAPAQFPPEAHDALAERLETLQESMDIEFPSQWTRGIVSADGRVVVRLDLLASGALQVRLGVRPVKHGPLFTPGDGPALMLEGQGEERHGARRDRQAERQAAHALAERLDLGAGEELEPWCWRVSEGDPALHLVATLEEMTRAAAEPEAAPTTPAVVVEWADERRLLALGSVGRGEVRLRVGDRRDWFAVEGGAAVGDQVVPLFQLLAAIREGRRYVAVGSRGFVRIEETLRAALAKAEASLFEYRGGLQASAVASDPLVGLVEEETQIEASAAFQQLRRRIREGAEADVQTPQLFSSVLRPYQRAGVEWMLRLAHWGAGAILADEMGLGKTLQTLAVLARRAELGPALVVAPTSVVPNWVAEAARFVPELAVRVYRGSERRELLAGLHPGDLVVTSYAIAALDGEALAEVPFASLVLDEAQAVKNATTERAKALRDLRAGWRLGLTGTPVENHLGELWSVLRVISPGLLGSWEAFRGRYAVPIEKFGDQERRQRLADLLRPFVLRRTKGEVARELPARTEIVRNITLAPDERQLYEQLRQSTIAEMEEAKRNPDRDGGDNRMVMLAALTRLRQLCCHPRLVYPDSRAGSSKAAHLLELLAELREGGHKALVFSQFRSFLDLLAPRLRQHGLRILTLDGTTPAESRAERIAAFQAGEADVFLISLKAGGFGLNLTAADTVIHLDPWWNPAVEDQATARAHRIGQTRPVTAVRLVASGTVEEAVLALHAAKRDLATALLDGADLAARLGPEELASLIRAG